MIQVNLLPDIKMTYLRTQRNKRLVITLSALVTITFLTLLAIMALFVYVNQAQHTERLQKDVDGYLTELQAVEGLGDILTVQKQLDVLPQLHDQKPALTRLSHYLEILAPNNISLREISLDFTLFTANISGAGKSQIDVNTFADVLKNSYYTTTANANKTPVFNGVEFEIGVPGDDGRVAFTVIATFDLVIFDLTQKDVSLTVPKKTSTQSALRSDSLFDLSIPSVQLPQAEVAQ